MAIRRKNASPLSTKRRQDRLRKASRRRFHLETLEDRRVFAGPQLVSINPNTNVTFNLAGGANLFDVAPRDLTFRFDDGQVLDPASINNTNVVITRANGNGFGNGDDIVITPGYIGPGEFSNELIVRFKENLPDDQYRINIVGTGATPLRNIAQEAFQAGANLPINFELDLGAQIIAIVPQPMEKVGGVWQQQRNVIDIYFNNDDLVDGVANAENPNFYRLYFTNDTVQNTDDNGNVTPDTTGAAFLPTSVEYDPATDRARLTFANADLGGRSGTFRLRVGTNEANTLTPEFKTATDAGSSFAAANTSIVGTGGVLTAKPQIITAAIDTQNYPLLFPGVFTEPGHREIVDSDPHHNSTPDDEDGTPVVFYSIPAVFGTTLSGGPAFNLLAETGAEVKEVPRVQEALDLWAKYLGVKFVQTNAPNDDTLIIAKGDPSAIPTFPWTIAMSSARTDYNYDYGENFFQQVLQEIGLQIRGPFEGLGTDLSLPLGIFGGEPAMDYDNFSEPTNLAAQDIIHGQHLFRPDSIDIDIYRFTLQSDGIFTAETFSERLANSSALDTVVTIFRESVDQFGNVLQREMIARNDDYYSEDSFVRLDLKANAPNGVPYRYYAAVSASGGSLLDPAIEDSSVGGTSQGTYQLRLDFRPNAFNSLVDADNPTAPGTKFDGDLDGTPGGTYNFWFRTSSTTDTIFVDKSNTAAGGGAGTLASPYNEIDVALAAATARVNAQITAGQTPNVTVRILGNGSADGVTGIPYQIGTNALGGALPDGRNLEVPRGVNLQIDGGAVFKMRNSRIIAGSTGSSDDRSRGTIQILGTPTMANAASRTVGSAGTTAQVVFTSYNDDSFGGDTNASTTAAAAGNWGGIVFQNDKDHADQRYEFERNGIFVNYVNHADIRYGGGQVNVGGGISEVVNPIHMIEARPTVTFNRIRFSADAAMSADPDSFEETNFHAPNYQVSASFTSDYDRVGPDIWGNTVIDNSLNGLFVRISTLAGNATKQLTVAGRFDDLDITHILKENLLIKGTAGGGIQNVTLPPIELVTLAPRLVANGQLPVGTYNYRITWVDAAGNESPASNISTSLTIAAPFNAIRLGQLPTAPAGFVARKIYRSENDGSGPYVLVAQISPNATTFDDTGVTAGGFLNTTITGQVRARLDASLTIDPGIIMKMDGARIETSFGTQLLAEGKAGAQIIFTTVRDDRYGAGGTFDVSGGSTPNSPVPGDWAGIFASPTSSISLDNVVVAYGGGVQRIGGTFIAFNALEIHMADARVTNSYFEFNASGVGGQGPINRFGAGFNEAGTIFVREAQPIIVNNVIRHNTASAININANALTEAYVVDWGRSTDVNSRFAQFDDNQGPMVRLNRMVYDATLPQTLNNLRPQISGMEVRGETLRTEGVWDDTDIVHTLFETIYIPNFHTFGGLRLESSATQSLIVKLQGAGAGFTAMGTPLDIDDRIGGMLHIVGQPGRPVVLTSLRDDTIGAGSTPTGRPLTDTNSDNALTTPQPGDWRSVRLDQFSHDRNVELVTEYESATVQGGGANSILATAQLLGQLAPNEKGGDENRRLGFQVHGQISNRNDVDIYTFVASPGTEVWFDIDRTSYALDTVIELIDGDGNVLAASDNSYEEDLEIAPLQGTALKMQKLPPFNGTDHWSTNVYDAGMRVVLPGPQGTLNTYHLRVRSRTDNSSGEAVGVSQGLYKLQIRLREIDEQPGSTVRFSDIRYARNGVEVWGQPGHSPLLGEATEGAATNDFLADAVNLGALGVTDRAALSIAGALGKVNPNLADVDFYRFYANGFTTFDLDYVDGIRPSNMQFWVFDANGRVVLRGQNSNLGDDQPGAVGGTNLSDLSKGSVGTNDPFVGTALLPAGVYYVAVGGPAVAPVALADPLMRLEPIRSVQRIAEDHIGFSGGQVDTAPIVPQLINGNTIVPWNLGDVTLFVGTEQGTNFEHTVLYTVDPFTGAVETVYGNVINGVPQGTFPYDVGDLVLRGTNGQLYAFRTDLQDPANGPDDAESGNYLQINPENGQVVIPASGTLDDDGIITYELDSTGAIQQGHFANGPTRIGWGVQFNAMAYLQTASGELLYAVGNRGDANLNTVGPTVKQNIMYAFLPDTGEAVANPDAARIDGAGTNAIEMGEVLVAPRILVPDPTITRPNPVATAEPPIQTLWTDSLQDGQSFVVRDGTITTGFEFDIGYEVRQTINRLPPNLSIVNDGDFFVLDSNVFQFNTGRVIDVNIPNGEALADGIIVTVQGINPANGQSVTKSFEFNYAVAPPPPATAPPPYDPGATQLDYGPGTTTLQMAGLLAAAINADATLGITATALGNRISMVGDISASVNRANPLTPPAGVSWVTLTGDTNAAPVFQVLDPTLINEGDLLTVRVGSGANIQNIVFEFDVAGDGVAGGRRQVDISGAVTPNDVVQAINNAVNVATAPDGRRITSRMGGDKIAINGENITFVSTTVNASAVRRFTTINLIAAEETFTDTQIGAAVNTFFATSGAFNAVYDVGAEAARINFHGATVMEASGTPIWTLYDAARPGVASVNAQIRFNADDTPTTLATKVAAAMNVAFTTPGGGSFNTATATANFVRLDHGDASSIVLDPALNLRLTIEGQGPGGLVTGMAQVDGQLFAVTDRGGLHRVNPTLPVINAAVTTTYVTTSRDDLSGINFQGLAAGPASVEGGRYSNMLFGISQQGRLYAMDTNGVLQNVFVNGATSVDTGRTNVRGLAFGNLDSNLWHQTGRRGADAGHGINASFDGIFEGDRILDQAGGASMYFGSEGSGNYNFAGGAYGTVVSEEFSLKGYSPLDLPTLYFNYFGQTDTALDSFRVFVGGADGQWTLLSNNLSNSNGGWRQFRVDLGAFAGQEHLRLRFDVSSAGDMNVGHAGTTGDELRAVPATMIEDEDLVIIDGNRFFEFEMGQIIVPSSSAGLYDGQELELVVNTAAIDQLPTLRTFTFEFDNDGAFTPGVDRFAIPFNAVQTSAEVARNLRAVINAAMNGVGVDTYLVDNRLNVKGLFQDIVDTTPGGEFSSITILGSVGTAGAPNTVPVDINIEMSRVEVASALDAMIEDVYTPQVFRFTDGSNYSDGQSFELVDNRDPVLPVTHRFEIDTGWILEVPSAGVDPLAGIVDTDFFSITDGVTTVTYEFDTDQVSTITPGRIRIPVAPGATQPSVAAAIAGAINTTAAGTRAQFGLQATVLGNGRVQLSGANLPTLAGPLTTSVTSANAPGVVITDSPGVTLGSRRVYITPSTGFSANQVAQNMRAAMAAEIPATAYTFAVNANDQARVSVTRTVITSPDLILQTVDPQTLRMKAGSEYQDIQTFQVVDSSSGTPVAYTFEFDTGYVLDVPIPGMNPVGGIVDGDFFVVSDGINSIRYEFDTSPPPSFTETQTLRRISVTDTSNQAQVAQAIATAINNTPLFAGSLREQFGLGATVLNNGRVQISGVAAPTVNLDLPLQISNPNLRQSGIPGVATGNRRVYLLPTATAAQVATEVSTTFNLTGTLNATYQLQPTVGDPALLQVIKLNANAPDLDINALGVADAIAMEEIEFDNVSKQHRDLLRIIGHTVTFSGPLGLEQALDGDVAGDPFFIRNGFNNPARAANNALEGVYFDDIVIGFAERGEMVTGVGANATFTNIDPVQNRVDDLVVGTDLFGLVPYQLEIRYGEEYDLTGSIETNDRLNESFQIEALPGSQLVDGQNFTVGNGINSVRFEFDDTSIFPTNGFQAGSIQLPFNPQMTDWQVAAMIRDAINSTAVLNALPGVSASLGDHEHVTPAFGDPSTSVHVNLFGPAVAQVLGVPIEIVNDAPTANELRDYLLGPGITTLGDAVYIGGPRSAGFFQRGDTTGIKEGIILSTGDVNDAEGPNFFDFTSGNSSGLPDAQLDALYGVNTVDTTSLEFQIVHNGGDLQFEFVFASEEYNEFVGSGFNDVFALFVNNVNLALVPGTNAPVSINTINQTANSEFYVNNDPSNNGRFLTAIGFDGFTEVLTAQRNLPTGVYTIRLVISDVDDDRLDSAVLLKAGSLTVGPAEETRPPEGIPGRVFTSESDGNLFRDQGQILIHSNVIRDSLEYGVSFDAGQRNRPELNPTTGNPEYVMGVLPHAGPARVLRDVNNEKLAPGVVIANNVVARGGTGGINFTGDSTNVVTAGQQSSVPFGRIVNNTIYGTGQGVGINVADFAAPTILNNIVSNNAVGVSVDASSGPQFQPFTGVQFDRTIMGGMLFQGNVADTAGIGLGDFPLVLTTEPLFVDPTIDNYYLSPNSPAIDSSVQNLEDRANLVSIRSPLGIDPSPILAPTYDVTGQLRVDDINAEPPFGIGQNVFVDRGAVDRVDTVGPSAILINPEDNGVGDNNLLATVVSTNVTNLTSFRIQIIDGVQPADPANGTGVQDSSVLASKLTLSRDGTLLNLGTDYTFAYDATNNIIILTPLTGIWITGSYFITLDNSATGILDLADNPLKPNQSDNTTTFTINLNTGDTGPGPGGPATMDFGDAPAVYVTTLPDGPRHVVVPNFQLGLLNDRESNGLPTAAANGDGADDDGIVFGANVAEDDFTMRPGRANTRIKYVAPAGGGILNAWIDYNGDGDWNDIFVEGTINNPINRSEHVAIDLPVTGNGEFFVTVPQNAKIGTTFARFRLSAIGETGLDSDGILANGQVPAGEVEDYAVQIIANQWQNPNATFENNLRYDVNGDSRISLLDAAFVINRINFSGTTNDLGVPGPGDVPPYIDVNGDNALTNDDAAALITFLNFRANNPQPEFIDVNPAASPMGAEAMSGTGSTTTEDASFDDGSSAAVFAPLSSSEPAEAALAPQSEPPMDYGTMAAAAFSDPSLLNYGTGGDDDEYDAILSGGSADAEADDFFAWFGQ